MIFKGSEYREKVRQNTLYVIRHSRLVQFVEPQNGADEDFVNVKFTLKEGQYGEFAHEYRPGFLNAAKKVDNGCSITHFSHKILLNTEFSAQIDYNRVQGKQIIL